MGMDLILSDEKFYIIYKVCGVRQGSRPGTRERGWFLLEVIEILKVKENLGV